MRRLRQRPKSLAGKKQCQRNTNTSMVGCPGAAAPHGAEGAEVSSAIESGACRPGRGAAEDSPVFQPFPARVAVAGGENGEKNCSAPANFCSRRRSVQGIAHHPRGRVRIFKSSASGREQVLALNVPGESVAEFPVFDDGRYPASAIAMEETEIAFISRKDFPRLLSRPPGSCAQGTGLCRCQAAQAGRHYRGVVLHHDSSALGLSAGSSGAKRGQENRAGH